MAFAAVRSLQTHGTNKISNTKSSMMGWGENQKKTHKSFQFQLESHLPIKFIQWLLLSVIGYNTWISMDSVEYRATYTHREGYEQIREFTHSIFFCMDALLNVIHIIIIRI